MGAVVFALFFVPFMFTVMIILDSGIIGKIYNKVVYKYKQYRCGHNRQDAQCDFKKPVNENRLEKLMLADVEKYDMRNWGGNAYEYALTLCLDSVLKL